MTHRIATITLHKIKYSNKNNMGANVSIGIAKNYTGYKITTVIIRRSAG